MARCSRFFTSFLKITNTWSKHKDVIQQCITLLYDSSRHKKKLVKSVIERFSTHTTVCHSGIAIHKFQETIFLKLREKKRNFGTIEAHTTALIVLQNIMIPQNFCFEHGTNTNKQLLITYYLQYLITKVRDLTFSV